MKNTLPRKYSEGWKSLFPDLPTPSSFFQFARTVSVVACEYVKSTKQFRNSLEEGLFLGKEDRQELEEICFTFNDFTQLLCQVHDDMVHGHHPKKLCRVVNDALETAECEYVFWWKAYQQSTMIFDELLSFSPHERPADEVPYRYNTSVILYGFRNFPLLQSN